MGPKEYHKIKSASNLGPRALSFSGTKDVRIRVVENDNATLGILFVSGPHPRDAIMVMEVVLHSAISSITTCQHQPSEDSCHIWFVWNIEIVVKYAATW
jgi:hypothetical protein